MAAFNVYLEGKLIDTVFYDNSFTASQVKFSLTDRDGYNANIKVCKVCNKIKQPKKVGQHAG